jgi:hypothetical protein
MSPYADSMDKKNVSAACGVDLFHVGLLPSAQRDYATAVA